MTNTDPRIKELNALAVERKGRFYFHHGDGRFRLLRNNTLHTFASLGEAEALLVSLPIPPPEPPPEPRPRGVELYRMPQSVTSRVYSSVR